jgi:hypothetical protein
MQEFIWHWTKGNKKIYTRRTDVADKAMKEGNFVVVLRKKPHIFCHTQM